MFAALDDVMPRATLQAAARLQFWVCENARSLRAYLKRVDELVPLSGALQTLHIQELPHAVHKKGDHLGAFDATPLLAPALAGHDMGLASEAGMPAIADPGSSVVRAAHTLGVTVVPLVGPVSLLLALAASGLNGQCFAFVGYLPQEAAARAARIKELEALSRRGAQTQLVIETPYRNAALLAALVLTLSPTTRLSVSCGLTLPGGWTRSDSVARWRARPAQVADPFDRFDRVPAVFAWLA